MAANKHRKVSAQGVGWGWRLDCDLVEGVRNDETEGGAAEPWAGRRGWRGRTCQWCAAWARQVKGPDTVGQRLCAKGCRGAVGGSCRSKAGMVRRAAVYHRGRGGRGFSHGTGQSEGVMK
eukprot:591300-Rhodomonas_salina.1